MRESELALFERAREHGERVALVDGERRFSYAELRDASARVAATLLGGRSDLQEGRVAFLTPPGIEYAALLWGIWRAGGIAVPLSVSAAEPELAHVLSDADVEVAVATPALGPRIEASCRQEGVRVLDAAGVLQGEEMALPEVSAERRAMILYTSGTTSRPKGVVSTHLSLQAQVTSLVEAWGWRRDDRIPLFLPLHHVHGIVNVLLSALWSGALVEPFPAFDRQRILERVGEGAYTLFMAVPTIYVKLIQALEAAPSEERESFVKGFAAMRLMISGSAALPASVHKKWTGLTSQRLLERYGMTEIGMGLSNPLEGERRPGAVGQPLPGVEVRLVSESGQVVMGEEEPGEIQVRGPAVFQEYWRRPEVTSQAFVDGWFRTGDMAVVEDGYYRIMGRLSVDIIKSGGEKISALEIEEVLRRHPGVQECAVVGVPDDTWGEAVAAAVIPRGGVALELESVRDWARDHLSRERLPRRLLVVDDLPRNAMGKVMKPVVKTLFASEA